MSSKYDIIKQSKDSGLIYELVTEKVNDAINDIAKEFGIDNKTVSDKLDMEYRGVYKLLVECIYKELVENNKVNELPSKTHRWIYDDDIMNQFWELGFDILSYSNDICDSIGKEIYTESEFIEEAYFQIFLANSHTENVEQEQFNTSTLCYYEDCELIEEIYRTDDITELLSMFKSL